MRPQEVKNEPSRIRVQVVMINDKTCLLVRVYDVCGKLISTDIHEDYDVILKFVR